MMGMILQRALRPAVLAMLLLASSAVGIRAQEKAPRPAAADAAPGAAKAGKSGKMARPDRPVQPPDAKDDNPQATQGLGAVGKVLPIGQKNIDVKIPSFKDGIPSSTVRASSMTRLHEENFSMEGMDIRLYGQSHEQVVRIRLATALYHMPSQILSSETRSRVSREDFDLQGDSMVFDTRTGQGKMTGNVRMVIFDADSLTGQKQNATSAAKEKTSPSDNTSATDKKPEGPSAPASAPASAPSSTTPSSPPQNEKK
jgi:hypothetical protein